MKKVSIGKNLSEIHHLGTSRHHALVERERGWRNTLIGFVIGQGDCIIRPIGHFHMHIAQQIRLDVNVEINLADLRLNLWSKHDGVAAGNLSRRLPHVVIPLEVLRCGVGVRHLHVGGSGRGDVHLVGHGGIGPHR